MVTVLPLTETPLPNTEGVLPRVMTAFTPDGRVGLAAVVAVGALVVVVA